MCRVYKGKAEAVTAARASLEVAIAERRAEQDAAKAVAVAVKEKEQAAAEVAEHLATAKEALRVGEIAAAKAESVSKVAERSYHRATEVTTELAEREQNASLEARLDDEQAIAAEKNASALALAAAQMQEEVLTQALLLAATHGDESNVEHLLEKGVDGVRPHIDVGDRHGETALTKAALNDHRTLVEFLLRNGADASKLPVRAWSCEQVMKWCESQFRWFDKYRETFVTAAVDGEALLEYGEEKVGEAMLSTDLAVTVGAHRRVIQSQVAKLCAAESARETRHRASMQAERRNLDAQARQSDAREKAEAEAKSRARLIALEERREERKPNLSTGTRQAGNGDHEREVEATARRALIDNQLLDPQIEVDEEDRHHAAWQRALAEQESISVSVRTPEGKWHRMKLGRHCLISEV